MKKKLESRMYKGWILNPLTEMTIKGERVMLYKAMKNREGIRNTYTDEDEELIDKWTGGYTNAG